MNENNPNAQAPAMQFQQVQMTRSSKDVGIAYLLWLFLGLLGAHKFYLGRAGIGVAYLFTLGFLGIGVLIDLFTLPSQVRQVNLEMAVGLR